jgi:nitroreductase
VFSAPLYVLVLVDKTVRYKGYEEKDGSLAAANIMLAARALGYGTVFYTDSVPEDLCMRHLDIPEKYSRTCVIPIGVPESWPEKRKRLPLDELVFREKIA